MITSEKMGIKTKCGPDPTACFDGSKKVKLKKGGKWKFGINVNMPKKKKKKTFKVKEGDGSHENVRFQAKDSEKDYQPTYK